MARTVADLGVAAYLMVYGFKVLGKRDKKIYFEVTKEDDAEFDDLQIKYLCSEYHRFDSCLMALKKMGENSFKGHA